MSISQDACRPRVVVDPGMHRSLLHGNREISTAVPASRGPDVVGKAVADGEKSDLPEVARKRANKAASAAAEPVERRGGAKENAELQRTVRTQSREPCHARRTAYEKPSPGTDRTQRPLGIAAIEDKIVQAAVVTVLTPNYESEFLGFSYGFRPQRNQHQSEGCARVRDREAADQLVLDCDVQSFFDKVDRNWLVRFVEDRIGDRRIVRLIAKWLTAGVLEDGQLVETEEGTPLLANIYLHHVYDQSVHSGDPSLASSIGTKQSNSLPISRRGSLVLD